MKIEKTQLNEDGTTTITMNAKAEEAEVLMQFAINFLISTGLSAVSNAEDIDEDDDGQLDMFDVNGELPN